MPRPTREFPLPTLRTVNRHFKIRWYADGMPYQISLGAIGKAKAQAICAASAAAFADRAEFPDEIRDEPALKRYLLTKNNITANTSDESLITQYIVHMQANSDSQWHMSVKGHLKRAVEFMGTEQNQCRPLAGKTERLDGGRPENDGNIPSAPLTEVAQNPSRKIRLEYLPAYLRKPSRPRRAFLGHYRRLAWRLAKGLQRALRAVCSPE